MCCRRHRAAERSPARPAPPDRRTNSSPTCPPAPLPSLKESTGLRPSSDARIKIEEERKNLIDLVTKLDNEGKITVRKKAKGGILDGEEAADSSGRCLAVLSSAAPFAAKPREPAGDPVKAKECLRAARRFTNRARLAEAIQQFHFAIQAQNTFWQAYQYLGAAYTAQGMAPQAAGAYERMIELNPDPALKSWVTQWKASVGIPTQAEAV